MIKRKNSPAAFSWFTGPSKVSKRWVEWLHERLTTRDLAIIADVARLRVVTGHHLERLHFSELADTSRARQRRRVLSRLVSWRVLASSYRRVGGLGGGSAITVYALDSAGQILTAIGTDRPRVRRPALPSERTLAHLLAVSSFYVELRNAATDNGLQLLEFLVEPACWWPDGLGGLMKPDAYLVAASGPLIEHWWIEVDLDTEHLPEIHRKISTYLTFYHRRARTPAETIMPRILLTVPTSIRRQRIRETISRMPPPATDLVHVVHQRDAVAHLILRNE